jgi:hypothetical protein
MALTGCSVPPSTLPTAVSSDDGAPSCVQSPEVAEGREQKEESTTDEVNNLWQGRSGDANRSRCFVWQPAPAAPVKKGKKTVAEQGCCQPQSLIYARCRSQIVSCRLGDTSPVQWYTCAKQQGNTSKQPVAGSIMVLDGNARRKMATGHPVYVEAVRKNANTTWELRISHTNYDRQCRLDLDSAVHFDEQRMTASFHSGPWASWARDLKVLGFIVR